MVFGVPILKHFGVYQEVVDDVFETSTCRVC